MLRDRNTRRVLLARAISHTGATAAFFVGIWGRAAYDLDATPLQLSLLMAVLGVSSLVGTSVAGVLVDRFDPRRVLLIGELALAPLTLALALPDTMGVLTAVVGPFGVAGAIVFTGISSFPAYLTDDPDELVKVNAGMEAAGTLSFIAGPVLGALIVKFLSIPWVFVLDAVTSLVAVALVAPVAVRAVAKARRERATRELREGFAFAYSTRIVRFCLALGTLSWLSFGAFGALEPLFFKDVLRVGPEALGWVNGVFGLGIFIGAWLLTRMPRTVVSARSISLLTAFGGAGAVAYTGTTSLLVVVLGGLLWACALGMLFPMLRSLIQAATPDHLIGRSMGVLYTHHSIGELLPLTFVAPLAIYFGVQQVLVTGGVALAVVALLSLPFARRVDAARTEVVPTEPVLVPVEASLAPRVG